MDDILIIYDSTKTDPYTITTHINKIHINVKLNPTYETHNSIDFLDVTISRKQTKLEIDIYRKPTTTYTTINFLSNHPIEHKTATFRFYIFRMSSLPLNPGKKQKELQTIQSIAKNNNFPQHLLQNLTDRYNKKKLDIHKPTRKTTRSGPPSLIVVLR